MVITWKDVIQIRGWFRDTAAHLMSKRALVQISAYSLYRERCQRQCWLEGIYILKESFGFLEDSLIFDNDVIAGLGVRDHELNILRNYRPIIATDRETL